MHGILVDLPDLKIIAGEGDKDVEAASICEDEPETYRGSEITAQLTSCSGWNRLRQA